MGAHSCVEYNPSLSFRFEADDEAALARTQDKFKRDRSCAA